MAVETELKLRIAPQYLARLKRHRLLGTHQLARPVTRRLYNIYFDTPKLDLQRLGMALRLRRAGRRWLQTLKGGGSVQGGLHQRNEWEVPLSQAQLDFSAPDRMVWDELLPQKLRKKLQPVFTTDFSRSSRILQWHDAQIELCIDQGEVRCGAHSVPICELELELLSGTPVRLFELALALLEIVPFELESVSKAEQGYRLLAGIVAQPVKSVAPKLPASATLVEMLQTMIWSCLLHLQNNLHGAMHSDDAEYLHQMRVALRRLRVALRITAKLRADQELNVLSQAVAESGTALGRIREWDVFIADVARPLSRRMSSERGIQALLAASERRRDESYAVLRSEQQARTLQRLLLRFALWMNGSYWSWLRQSEALLPQVRDFAARRLRRCARDVVWAGQQLGDMEAQRLHALRISAKKLRYSAELFAPLYTAKRSRKFLQSLSAVQDELGRINDVTVAERLLDELAMLAELSAHQDAINIARGWIAHDLSPLFAALQKTIARFDKQQAFWEK